MHLYDEIRALVAGVAETLNILAETLTLNMQDLGNRLQESRVARAIGSWRTTWPGS
jgi:hypothetical protein